jgi:hypothetical protein
MMHVQQLPATREVRRNFTNSDQSSRHRMFVEKNMELCTQASDDSIMSQNGIKIPLLNCVSLLNFQHYWDLHCLCC